MLMLMMELSVECPTVRCFHGVAAKNLHVSIDQ